MPGVFSQGKTLEELEENVRDAYRMMMADDDAPADAQQKPLEIST